jgi:hypothetical protein
MTNITPVDNDLHSLIKGDSYRSIVSKISDKYTTMDKYINNLNSDIGEIAGLIQKLDRDVKRGYEVGTSLDTLNFQRDTLALDRDFFDNQKKTYLRKIYKDLFKYTHGIITKAIEIEDNPMDKTDEELFDNKLGAARAFTEEDEYQYNINDVFTLLGITERNLFELASDISTFKEMISDAESKEQRGFAVGNMILNLKEQESNLKLSFESYCTRLEQFLNENLKFSSKCVKRIEMISGEIKTDEELAEEAAQNQPNDSQSDPNAPESPGTTTN